MSAENYDDLARTKLARIFGDEKADRLIREIMHDRTIADARDLLAFSEALKLKGGFESTVGAMLCLQAVLRGARETPH